MTDLAWWQALASGALGGVFALAGQGLASWSQSKSARDARTDERRQVRAARRDAFELTQLDELHASVLRLSRAVGNYRRTQPRLTEITDTPEGDEFFAARNEVETLQSRTLDETVRKEVSELIGKSFPAATEESARYMLEFAGGTVKRVRIAIGDRIRTLYLHDGS